MPRAALPITLDVDEPQTVGADRIINTLAASRLYERDCIVVDLGTATTYDCITRDGVFIGGVIAPGVITSLETLTRRTSKLPATELRTPQRVIGRRTEECIRSGVVYGAVEAITGIVGRITRRVADAARAAGDRDRRPGRDAGADLSGAGGGGRRPDAPRAATGASESCARTRGAERARGSGRDRGWIPVQDRRVATALSRCRSAV